MATEGAAARPPLPVYVYHLESVIAQRHNPFVDLHAPPGRGGAFVLKTFVADLQGPPPPTCLVFVGWNDEHDGHDGGRELADRSLTALLDVLSSSPWFNTSDPAGRFPALFVCWDRTTLGRKTTSSRHGGGRGIRRGISSAQYTHYSFCRTMTDNWGLPAPGEGMSTVPIREPFTSGS